MSDVGNGADILVRAALANESAGASGRSFDNDAGRFAPPHPGALNAWEAASQRIEAILSRRATAGYRSGVRVPPLCWGAWPLLAPAQERRMP